MTHGSEECFQTESQIIECCIKLSRQQPVTNTVELVKKDTLHWLFAIYSSMTMWLMSKLQYTRHQWHNAFLSPQRSLLCRRAFSHSVIHRVYNTWLWRHSDGKLLLKQYTTQIKTAFIISTQYCVKMTSILDHLVSLLDPKQSALEASCGILHITKWQRDKGLVYPPGDSGPFHRKRDIYRVPFSHVLPELQISSIKLEISSIHLEISPIQLEISTNIPIWRYLQFNWRYLQIRPICSYLQFKCTYLQFDKSDKITAPRRKNRCAMIQVSELIKSCI